MRSSLGDRIKVLNMQIRLSVAAVSAATAKRIEVSGYVSRRQMLNSIALDLCLSRF